MGFSPESVGWILYALSDADGGHFETKINLSDIDAMSHNVYYVKYDTNWTAPIRENFLLPPTGLAHFRRTVIDPPSTVTSKCLRTLIPSKASSLGPKSLPLIDTPTLRSVLPPSSTVCA